MKYAVVLTNMIREDAAAYCKLMECVLSFDSMGQFIALASNPETALTIEEEMINSNKDFDPIKRKL